MKNKINNNKTFIAHLLYVIPLLSISYAFYLFSSIGRDVGLPLWLLVRNISIVFYICAFVYTKYIDKKKLDKNEINEWIISLIITIFSWAAGGFIFDVLNLEKIVKLQI